MRTALALAAMIAVTGCKPPATDADMLRDVPEAEPTFASDPLPSPNTEGAMWVPSPEDDTRIIYGIPGQPALLALECVAGGAELATLRIKRLSPADEGAGALLAMVGNGHIGRVAVDATKLSSRNIWIGEAPASDTVWEPLTGPRDLTVTVPGAGMMTVNGGALAGRFVDACRIGEDWDEGLELPEEAEPEEPA